MFARLRRDILTGLGKNIDQHPLDDHHFPSDENDIFGQDAELESRCLQAAMDAAKKLNEEIRARKTNTPTDTNQNSRATKSPNQPRRSSFKDLNSYVDVTGITRGTGSYPFSRSQLGDMSIKK